MTKITHYKLDDNRIWDIAQAKFIPAAPEDAVVGPCPDERGNSTEAGLRGCLLFYNYPLGELQTPEDRAEARRAEILQELADLDAQGARASRGIALAYAAGETPNAADVSRLTEIENAAKALRTELAAL